MFTAFNERNDFSYAFEKIRNAISAPGENNVYAATELGLGILLRKYEQFRRELDAAGELGNWEYDLDTYNHCIAVLQRYFTGNPSGLTERDARIGNDSNLLIVFYVQIMPDDFVMQLHRF
ncbi:hypothetical protein ACJHX1_23855 [Escherichia sp. WS401]